MLPMPEIHRRRAEPPIRQPTNTEFYFYIRGHIRNSFQTDRLKRFIQLVLTNFPNVIFILLLLAVFTSDISCLDSLYSSTNPAVPAVTLTD